MTFMTDVGFPDRGVLDRYNAYKQMCEHGEMVEANGARYLKWSAGERVELWTRVEGGRPGPLFYTYYSGEARMKVALIEKTPRSEPTLSDGAFLCRSGACAGEGWLAGRLPFVFDTPDYHLYHEVSIPRLCDVQLAGFAFSMKGYEDEEEFEEEHPADEDGYCWDYKYFVPAYYLCPRGDGGELQPASVNVSGYVRASDIVTNPATGLDFCWVRLETIGGEIDIVCSPDKIDGYVVEGGIATSYCYLYGRVLKDDCN